MFSEKIGSVNLLSPSLDLINIISVWAFEAMKVAGETLPAADSYLQSC